MLRYVRADWLEPNTPEPMDMHVWHLPESIWILKILGFWILDSGSRYTDPSNRCENPELRIQIPFLGSGFSGF